MEEVENSSEQECRLRANISCSVCQAHPLKNAAPIDHWLHIPRLLTRASHSSSTKAFQVMWFNRTLSRYQSNCFLVKIIFLSSKSHILPTTNNPEDSSKEKILFWSIYTYAYMYTCLWACAGACIRTGINTYMCVCETRCNL